MSPIPAGPLDPASARISPCTNGGVCQFELPVEQRYVATRLSMIPATLSRALSDLAATGVEARRRKVMIADLTALARFVNEDEH